MPNNISAIAENIQFFGVLLIAFLKQRLALSGRVQTNYKGAAQAPGDTINVPFFSISGGARTRTIGGAVTPDDMAAGYVSVTFAQIYKGVKIDNLQRTFSSIDLLPRIAEELATILGDGAESMLTALWSRIPYQVGKTDGSATFSAANAANVFPDARAILSRNKVPLNALNAVLGPSEASNLRKLDVVNIASAATETGGAAAIAARDTGELGYWQGFRINESQAIPNFIQLSVATDWGAGAAPTYGAKVNGVNAIGTTTLACTVGIGKTLKKGSIFTLKAGTASEQNYVVDADCNSDGVTGVVNIPIFPALKTATAANDPITPLVHSAPNGVSMGFAFDPNFALFVARPQADFMEGTGVRTIPITDDRSGFTLRLHFESRVVGDAGEAMTEYLTADFLAAAGIIDEKRAVRISGQN